MTDEDSVIPSSNKQIFIIVLFQIKNFSTEASKKLKFLCDFTNMPNYKCAAGGFKTIVHQRGIIHWEHSLVRHLGEATSGRRLMHSSDFSNESNLQTWNMLFYRDRGRFTIGAQHESTISNRSTKSSDWIDSSYHLEDYDSLIFLELHFWMHLLFQIKFTRNEGLDKVGSDQLWNINTQSIKLTF